MDNVGLWKEEIARGKGETTFQRVERLEVLLMAMMEHVALLDRIINPDGMVVATKK